MNLTETQRNFLILIAICVVGTLLLGPFGITAGTIFTIINIAFMLITAWWVWTWRRANASTIATMDAKWAMLLDACIIGLFVLWLTGRVVPPLWARGHGPGMTLVFWGAIGACAFGWYYAWQQRIGSRW